ncbi:hypothetical protein MKZ38_006724 [Zalerion maritima]|uniref:Uncharacterized protein n=1 Tax=Zalerion maritima TaxID=339359 RepID=A0AAD5WNL8_9PEZI|nr:hypothetical protein MKZ38_006724 [Zalerion maritima]
MATPNQNQWAAYGGQQQQQQQQQYQQQPYQQYQTQPQPQQYQPQYQQQPTEGHQTSQYGQQHHGGQPQGPSQQQQQHYQYQAQPQQQPQPQQYQGQQYAGGFTHAPTSHANTQIPTNYSFPPPPAPAAPQASHHKQKPQQQQQHEQYQGHYQPGQPQQTVYQPSPPAQHQQQFPTYTPAPPSQPPGPPSGTYEHQPPTTTQPPQISQTLTATPPTTGYAVPGQTQSASPQEPNTSVVGATAQPPGHPTNTPPNAAAAGTGGIPPGQPGSGLASRLNYKDWSKKFNKESAEKIFNKENADKMMTAGKKYFSTGGKILDKVSAPIMPILAVGDENMAAAWRMQQEMKLQKMKQQQQQGGQPAADGSITTDPAAAAAATEGTLGGQNAALLSQTATTTAAPSAATTTATASTGIPVATSTVLSIPTTEIIQPNASGTPQPATSQAGVASPASTTLQPWQTVPAAAPVTSPIQVPGIGAPQSPSPTTAATGPPTTQAQAPVQPPPAQLAQSPQTGLEDLTPLIAALQAAHQQAIASGQPGAGANEAMLIEMLKKQQQEKLQQQQQQQQQSPAPVASPLPSAIPQDFIQSPPIQASQPEQALNPAATCPSVPMVTPGSATLAGISVTMPSSTASPNPQVSNMAQPPTGAHHPAPAHVWGPAGVDHASQVPVSQLGGAMASPPTTIAPSPDGGQPSATASPQPPMTLYGKPVNPLISNLLAQNSQTLAPSMSGHAPSAISSVPMSSSPSPQSSVANLTPLPGTPGSQGQQHTPVSSQQSFGIMADAVQNFPRHQSTPPAQLAQVQQPQQQAPVHSPPKVHAPAQAPAQSSPATSIPPPTAIPNTLPLPRDALDTNTWIPFTSPVHGINSLVVPPSTTLIPQSPNLLQSTIPPGPSTSAPLVLEIELLFTPACIQSYLTQLHGLSGNAETPLTVPLRTRGDVLPQASAPLCVDGELSPVATSSSVYKMAVQSPFGHGIAVTVMGPREPQGLCRRHGEAVARSIQWVDRAVVGRNVSASFTGTTWRHTFPSPDKASQVPAMNGVSETREYAFAAGNRYTFRKNVAGVTDGYGNNVVGLGLPGDGMEPASTAGSFEVWEYNGGGVAHLVLIEDGVGTTVTSLKRGGEAGREFVEVEEERKYFRVWN